MPGYGVTPGNTYRIPLSEFDGSDNWVEITADRTSGAESRVQFAGMKITGVAADGTPIVAVRDQPLLDMRVQLFVEAIVAWSLKADEADAAPMALDRNTFAEVLTGDVGSWLDTQITTYYGNRRLSPEKKASSNGKSPVPFRGGAASLS